MQHPDLAVVQAEEIGGTMKVDQVRELQYMLSLAPYEAHYRVALFLRFEEAHPSASNALLKTLEEPPPQVVIILTALDAESLLPTIVSRCEVLRLRPLPGDIVSKGLCEQWGVPPDQAYLLAQISGGRPGYALYLHNNPEAQEERQAQLDEHQRLLSASYVERFDFANKLYKDKPRLRSTLQTWTSLWRDVMLCAAGSSTPVTNPDRKDDIDRLTAEIDRSTAQIMVSTLERMIRLMDKNVNPRLIAEVTVLDLPRIE
jgi:DNA polymerase-3 subunit delta'